MTIRRSILVFAALGVAACGGGEPPAPSDVDPGITIMTFNVENLFDNVDDPGKDDKTYLPLAAKQSDQHIAECSTIEVDRWRDDCLSLDWSDDVVEYKLGVVAAAIRQIDGGPDVVALQEVENLAILERLVTEHLGDLGYGAPILIEGQDTRGIDVAFLSKLPLAAEPVLHPLEFEDFPERQGDTRGVLAATFKLPDGALLSGFAVHFPAPFHPTAMREIAYRHLTALRDALPDSHHAFAAGDFNTTSTEIEQAGLLERLVRPHWTIAHETGCDGCVGTHYYARGDSWSFLDMILYSPARGENATWRIRADSTRIANALGAQRTADGTPLRFDPAGRRGVSDHWPLVVTIETAQKQ